MNKLGLIASAIIITSIQSQAHQINDCRLVPEPKQNLKTWVQECVQETEQTVKSVEFNKATRIMVITYGTTPHSVIDFNPHYEVKTQGHKTKGTK